MKIFVAGTGKMGSWLVRQWSGEHTVAVFDTDRTRSAALEGTTVLPSLDAVRSFSPDLCLNSVDLKHTIDIFRALLPLLPPTCMLSDVASVKTGLPEFYAGSGFRYVSVHPMFGPTFARLDDLRGENAVVISESDAEGKAFWVAFFARLGVRVYEYSMTEHDRMMAYSLTLPFVSSLVFSSCVSQHAVPGTTFRRHMDVAKGLLGEDDYLLSEILFNPDSLPQLERISSRLNFLWHIIKQRDEEEARRFFAGLRSNILPPPGPSPNSDIRS